MAFLEKFTLSYLYIFSRFYTLQVCWFSGFIHSEEVLFYFEVSQLSISSEYSFISQNLYVACNIQKLKMICTNKIQTSQVKDNNVLKYLQQRVEKKQQNLIKQESRTLLGLLVYRRMSSGSPKPASKLMSVSLSKDLGDLDSCGEASWLLDSSDLGDST